MLKKITIVIIGIILLMTITPPSPVYAEESFKIDFNKCYYTKLEKELKIKIKETKEPSLTCSKDNKTVKCVMLEGEIEYPIVFENNSSITFAYQEKDSSEVVYLNKKTKEARSQWILLSSDYIGGLNCVGTFEMIVDEKEK